MSRKKAKKLITLLVEKLLHFGVNAIAFGVNVTLASRNFFVGRYHILYM